VGVPAVVGRPVQRRHRVGTLFFYFFFLSFYNLLLLLPYSSHCFFLYFFLTYSFENRFLGFLLTIHSLNLNPVRGKGSFTCFFTDWYWSGLRNHKINKYQLVATKRKKLYTFLLLLCFDPSFVTTRLGYRFRLADGAAGSVRWLRLRRRSNRQGLCSYDCAIVLWGFWLLQVVDCVVRESAAYPSSFSLFLPVFIIPGFGLRFVENTEKLALDWNEMG